MQTYTLKVADIRKEAEDVFTICFKQPGLKKIKYRPGQYLTLIFRINGRRYLRPYSFSSAPEVDTNLEVTVKRVSGGIVSNHIIDKVKVDDVVEVMPPLGDFTFDEVSAQGKPVILWGAGSGITPLISIAKYILIRQIGNPVTLVYGNRSHDSTIFAEQIEALQQRYSTQFSVWHFHTQLSIDKINPNIIQGRIKPSQVLSVIRSNNDLNNSLHYICGPTGLKESVKEALYSIGVKADHVFSEDFEVVKNPKDFDDIATQLINIAQGQTVVQVEVAKGKSILEAGLDASLELSYSCQTGNCSLCKAKLTRGEVKMIGLTKERNDLADDERLLCCSYPITDDVQITI